MVGDDLFGLPRRRLSSFRALGRGLTGLSRGPRQADRDFPRFALHGVALSDVGNGTTKMSAQDDAWSSSLVDVSAVPGFSNSAMVSQCRLDDYVSYRLP